MTFPDLTISDMRLLQLLATPLSLQGIAQLLETPHGEVLAQAKSSYAKLGLSAEVERPLTESWFESVSRGIRTPDERAPRQEAAGIDG
jgi:hypothetical protein